jgi:dTDP-4-dehydrorhamnose reductase
MLGHVLFRTCADRFDTYGTVRRPTDTSLLDIAPQRLIDGVDAEHFATVARTVEALQPDVVVNCIGAVKQSDAARDPVACIEVNALFPHRLARLCREAGTRLIHISTDCVFSGRRGNYGEDDTPDPDNLYGHAKLLGEVSGPATLTLRTSFIGPELDKSRGLLEWFLHQSGTVRGFRRAIFSGFTTDAISEVIVTLINDFPDMAGLWHVASEPVNKFELLSLIKRVYDHPIEIAADDTIKCDRSLNGGRFLATTGIRFPSWPAMIEQMHDRSISSAGTRRVPC